MPTIKRFSNCAIEIYNWEHGRPHFHVIFSDGDRCAIDIETLEVLAGDVKRPARLWGHSVTWEAGVDLGADNLYQLCKEQAGEPSPQRFDAWMHRNHLSLTTAAEALGLSRRMIAHYRTGSRPIPKIVGLACIGWEEEQQRRPEQA